MLVLPFCVGFDVVGLFVPSVGKTVVGSCVSPVCVGFPVVGLIVSAVGILLVGTCVSPKSVGFAVLGMNVVGERLSVGKEVVGL